MGQVLAAIVALWGIIKEAKGLIAFIRSKLQKSPVAEQAKGEVAHDNAQKQAEVGDNTDGLFK